MAQSKLIRALPGLALSLVAATTAGAQAAPHLQSGAQTSITPGSAPCSNVLTVQIFASIASACATTNSGGSASASGQINAATGQMTASASASWTGGPAVTAVGAASYVDSLTITGDLTRIYRAFMTASMDATASFGSGLGAAHIFLFADLSAPDGTFLGGTSWTTQTSGTYNLSVSGARSLDVFSAVLAQSSSAIVRFGIGGTGQVTADESNPSAWANVAFSAPAFRIVDQAGADITDQYSLTFASGRIVATPEPASLLLVSTGLSGLALRFRRRRAGKAA